MADKPSNLSSRIWANNAAGSDIADPDTGPLGSEGKFNLGWEEEEIPPHQWFNYYMQRVTQALAHMNERGIPIWDSATPYPANAYVVDNGILYISYFGNTDRPPASNPTIWTKFSAFAGNIVEATNTTFGLTRLASIASVSSGTSNSDVVTNAGLNARAATESLIGLLSRASQAQALGRTNNTAAMTPLRTTQLAGELISEALQNVYQNLQIQYLNFDQTFTGTSLQLVNMSDDPSFVNNGAYTMEGKFFISAPNSGFIIRLDIGGTNSIGRFAMTGPISGSGSRRSIVTFDNQLPTATTSFSTQILASETSTGFREYNISGKFRPSSNGNGANLRIAQSTFQSTEPVILSGASYISYRRVNQ